MEYSLVIKVKYGGTLRRFNARVDENNHLDLDMAGLRAKILSFFDFAADANLVLRYVDEDGDLVTLVDDADLQDVMKQNLKFLKIDVLASNGSGAKSNGSSSGSATATPSGSAAATPSGSAAATPRSPPTPNPFITTNVVLPPDAFKAVPEPIRGPVEKITTDLLSSSPVASAIIDSMIKGIPVPDPHGQAHAAPGPSSGNGVPKESSSPEARVPRSTSGDSNSNTSPQTKPENAAGGVPNAGRPVTENLREAFSKLTIDLLSSNPMTAGLADFLSKAGDGARRGPSVIPIPENLHEILSKLANDLRSSGPITVNLGDSLSKIGIPNVSPYFQASVAAGVGSNNGVPKESTSSAARGPQPTRVDSSSNVDQTVETGNVTRGVAAGISTNVDLNTLPTDPNSSQSTNVHAVPVSPAVPDCEGKKGKKCADDSSGWKGESSGTFPNYPVPNRMPVQTAATGSGAFNACPFARAAPVDFGQGFPFGPGVPVNTVQPRQGFAFAPHIPLVPPMPPPMRKQGTHSFKRSPNHTEASGMFHRGVRCDGCGVFPITGPRFKSKVKENYDLCTICINEKGNESDYIRIDRPLSARASHCFSSGYPHRNPTGQPHDIARALSKYAKPKLDSQFILDVNVIDGTMMAPSTAFTKIWRMRNNGTHAWREGTQLVWTGGDQFSDRHSVYLEVPEDGVPVDKELDIAVDFRAPLLPGRYVSYWRMASPSGHRFGQRVWVLIQVDASLKDSFYSSSQGLNLNIPLLVDGDVSKGPHTIDINAQPTEDDAFLQHLNPDVPTEPVNQVADKQPMQDLENKLPVDEAKFVGPSDSTPAAATSVPSSSISYPIIDLSATAPAVPSDQQSSAVDAQPAALPLGTGGGNNPVEETMLKELEEMGFRQVDLNKEILRMNEYNLEQSVDDLCGVSEWDPILEELQEMGFHDNEVNKRLLKKNNGSIKRVVMDLINGGD